MEIQNIFITNLKNFRRKKKLTQKDLALLCGLSKSYIAELEAGRRFPSHETMQKLCRNLGIRPYELFYDPMTDFVSLEDGKHVELFKVHVRERLQELINELD